MPKPKFYFQCKTILNGRFSIIALPTIHKVDFIANSCLYWRYISSAVNQQSFVVSYLISMLGFSPEVAQSASRYVSFESPERADIVVKFFKSHGFTQTQISNLVRRLPSVLLSDPNKTLLPKIEFFVSKGMSRPDLAKLLSGYPAVLKRSLENQIIPSFDFFASVLKSEVRTIQAVKRFSGILIFDLETYMSPNMNILRENGVPESSIRTLLEYQPRSLVVNPVRFREIVEEVKEMGFNPLRLKFSLAVFAFRAMSKSTWESKVEVYKKWGWSEHEIFEAFARHPWCMMASKEKITGVMDFFVNEMGLDSKVLLKRPSLFSSSLKNRLIPRGLVFQVLLSKDLIKKDIGISRFFESTDEMFLQKFVVPHKEEVSDLSKLLDGKLDLCK